jgi:hypothetical protein
VVGWLAGLLCNNAVYGGNGLAETTTKGAGTRCFTTEVPVLQVGIRAQHNLQGWYDSLSPHRRYCREGEGPPILRVGRIDACPRLQEHLQAFTVAFLCGFLMHQTLSAGNRYGLPPWLLQLILLIVNRSV